MNVQLLTLADQIRARHEGAIVAARKTVTEIVECARLLISARTRCSHGEWYPFLERCRINEKTFRRYAEIYKAYDELKKSGRFQALLANGACVAEILRAYELVKEHEVGPYRTEDYKKRKAAELTEQLELRFQYDKQFVPTIRSLIKSSDVEELGSATLRIIQRDLLAAQKRVDALLAEKEALPLTPDHQP